ncbi:hypothetical protein [Lacrimispora celerecrescens]|nr:hypothetical protein [Lacrimispora celerecrescens]
MERLELKAASSFKMLFLRDCAKGTAFFGNLLNLLDKDLISD